MYTIKLLPPAQYRKLPFKHTGTSFGLADPKKGIAYVKESGIPALDLLNVGHEIQELVSKVSPHEEDGIRYKKGRSIASIVVPIALGLLTGGTGFTLLGMSPALTGSLLGAAAGGGISQSPMGALSGALGGFGGAGLGSGAVAGWQAAGSAGKTLLGQVGGAARGAIMGTASGAGGPMSLLGKGGTPVGLLPTASAATGTLLGKAATTAGGALLSGAMSPAAQQQVPSYSVYNIGNADLTSQPSQQLGPAPIATQRATQTPTTTEYLPGMYTGTQSLYNNYPFLTRNPYDIYRRYSFIA